METVLKDISFILPEIFITIFAMALLIVGVYKKDDGEASSIISTLSSLVLVVALVLLFFTADRQAVIFNELFVVDNFSLFMKALIIVGSLVGITFARVDFKGANAWRFEIPVLILLSCVGMMIMVSANNYMTLYMGLELQSLSLYVLAASKRDNLKSTEAGLKYFVLGALSSGLILYGISLLYGYTGSLGFDATKIALTAGGLNVGALVGMVFLLAGIAFKISAVPFHMWTPDVYEGSSTSITAFFATAPKVAAMGLLIRVLYDPLGSYIDQWQQVIIFISVASMVIGAFAAIWQTNIKRLLAYSSIGHIGYALMALAVGDINALSSLLFYIAVYIVMSFGAFGLIIYLRQGDRAIEDIADFSGMYKSQPVLAAIMAIFMFSLAGIPPLGGFIAKLYVFNAVVASGYFWLAVVGVLTSVVAAYYYIRVVKVMYFEDPAQETETVSEPFLNLIIMASAIVIVLLIVEPSIISAYATEASRTLFLPIAE
tara:strand:+ start:865 stop:2325 length:1461 start_codon:yes stop_codon:yes gene_type:complete